MNSSVLIVDDEPAVRDTISRTLDLEGYTVAEAADGLTATSVAATWKPELVLLDVRMPGIGGLECLRRMLETDPHIAVIMITSVDEVDTVRKALKLGSYDYLVKPVDLGILTETVRQALENRALRIQVERYRSNLESLVYERTEALEKAVQQLDQTYTQTVLALGAALEMRDVETQSHSVRVAGFTIALCRELGVNDEERFKSIRRGAYLHDVGKIGVPDEILRKPGPLDKEEWAVMRRHPMLGVHMLDGILFLRDSLTVVRSHHEQWDGTGYPDGLAGTGIPLEARAFAVADALDAITSDRPYRAGRSVTDARRIIAGASGSHFDPDAVSALGNISDEEIDRIREQAEHPFRSS